jgi:hypothetical protein
VRNFSRGRAHLEKLLGRAEKVVRLSPADVIVLTGIPGEGGDDMSQLLSLFEQFEIEARGLIVLGPGMDIDSIDMEELIRMDALTEEVEEGETVDGSTSVEGLSLPVQCPRCNEMVVLTISASIQDTGKRMVGGASVDDRDLELHAMVCPGKKPTSE